MFGTLPYHHYHHRVCWRGELFTNNPSADWSYYVACCSNCILLLFVSSVVVDTVVVFVVRCPTLIRIPIVMPSVCLSVVCMKKYKCVFCTLFLFCFCSCCKFSSSVVVCFCCWIERVLWVISHPTLPTTITATATNRPSHSQPSSSSSLSLPLLASSVDQPKVGSQEDSSSFFVFPCICCCCCHWCCCGGSTTNFFVAYRALSRMSVWHLRSTRWTC